ncbi:MAG: hypothetical protein H0U27_04815 [Nitrosopumilus sp.]|nr:hypothetical protein [Nitrosopumilus sp.]
MKTKNLKAIRTYNSPFRALSFAMPEEENADEFLFSEIKYNEKGNIIEESNYTSENRLEEKRTYKYDENGKLIEETVLHAAEDFEEKRKIIRDEKGHSIEEIREYPDGTTEKTIIKRDDNENITEIIVLDEDGEQESRQLFKYDDKNNLKSHVKLDMDGEVIEATECECDEHGNIIAKKEILPEEGIEISSETEYDEQGRELRSTAYNEKGQKISEVEIVYDEKGNHIETISKDYINRADSRRITFSYDDKNCIEERVMTLNDELLRQVNYCYDDNGNLIEEESLQPDYSKGGKQAYKKKYEYEYY